MSDHYGMTVNFVNSVLALSPMAVGITIGSRFSLLPGLELEGNFPKSVVVFIVTAGCTQ